MVNIKKELLFNIKSKIKVIFYSKKKKKKGIKWFVYFLIFEIKL